MTDNNGQRAVVFTGQQMAALSIVELSMHTLAGSGSATSGLGAATLAAGCAQAIAALKAAHEKYIDETQRSVTLAAPSDIQAALHDTVRP